MKKGRYIDLDLPMEAEINLRKLIPISVCDEWMDAHNKSDLDEVEFCVYRPTSSTKRDHALMAVQEPCCIPGQNGKFLGFSYQNNIGYANLMKADHLLTIINLCKGKTPQLYLCFMSSSIAGAKRKYESPNANRPLTRASQRFEGKLINR